MDIEPLRAGTTATWTIPVTAPSPCQEAGRRCAHPGCATRLSRYNPDDRCTAHGGWSDASVKRPGRKPGS